MAYSPDGKTLAHVVAGRIRLRDATTGKPVLDVPGLPAYDLSVRFAPDGKTLIASCSSGDTGSWDPVTGRPVSPSRGPPAGFAGHSEMLLETALTADSRRAALVDSNSVLHVWEPVTGKLYCRIADPPVGEDQVDFSSDGKFLAVKHKDHIIRVWDTETGKMRCALRRFGQGRYPHPHAFSPDGRILATGPGSLDDSVIRMWDPATGNEVGRLAWQDTTFSDRMVFSPDGKYLIAVHGHGDAPASQPDSVRVWDLASRRELRRFPTGASCLAISPDSKTLAAAVQEGVQLWELASGKERGRFFGHIDAIRSLAFSPDGKLLASGSMDYTALVWDVCDPSLSAPAKPTLP